MKGWNYDFKGVQDGFYPVSALRIMGKKIASSDILCRGVDHEILCVTNCRVLTIGDILDIDINYMSSVLIRSGGVFSCMGGRLPVSYTEYDSPAFFARTPNLTAREVDSVGLFSVYQKDRRLLKQYYSWSVNRDTLERIFRPDGENRVGIR